MLFRTHDLLVRQRTQAINALRGQLSEHGALSPQGLTNVKVLSALIEEATTSLPLLLTELLRLFLEQIDALSRRIADLEKMSAHEAAHGKMTRRLQTMPGVGPITVVAIETFAPPMSTFKRGRDFAAWLGLVPRQYSTGGKQLLRETSKMGQCDIHRLLIIGAFSVMGWASRNGTPDGTWLYRMLAGKPRMLGAIALANKMVRNVWAMLTKNEDDKVLATAMA